MGFELRRRAAASGGGGDVSLDPEDVLAKRFPALFEFLTATKWPDGQRRQPGSLTFFFDSGCLKAALNDKDAVLTSFVSGAGLGAILAALEVGLQQDTLDWRAAGKRVRGKS